MGLIENLARRANKLGLGPKLIASLPYLSLLAWVAGILWLLVLPMDGQFRHTYISENALLPHQASTHFRESEWHITRGFRESVRELKDLPEELRNDGLADLFRGMALKTALHQWKSAPGFDEEEEGENFYGILHAPRGSHNEAIVIVAPWLNEEGRFNDGGVSLLVALAKYFRRWSVWHKNIIFVIPSNSHSALRSWVEAYHTTLKHTAGSIEGALVLDFPDEGEFFDHIDISYDGLNGQQPNLDLINTIVSVAESEGVRTEIHDLGPSYHLYEQRLRALLQGISQQVFSGLWAGPGSEMFSGWRIDAVTIRARGRDGGHDITTFGRIAESTVRSINNLLEHFHQSFFFYQLMGPKYFVSIGTYLPAAMLAANSFPIMAVYNLSTENMFGLPEIMTSFAAIGVIWALAALSALFTAWIPYSLVLKAILYASLATQAVLFEPVLSPRAKKLVQALALIISGLALTVLATLNFSQALVLAIAAYPLAWVSPSNKPSNYLLLTISCPLVGIFAMAHYLEHPVAEVIQNLIIANNELNVWTWNIINMVWVPLWLASLLVASSVSSQNLHPDVQ